MKKVLNRHDPELRPCRIPVQLALFTWFVFCRLFDPKYISLSQLIFWLKQYFIQINCYTNVNDITNAQEYIRYIRNPGRNISFPIFIRKEIETRKLERKSKQQISRLNDLLHRLNDKISR